MPERKSRNINNPRRYRPNWFKLLIFVFYLLCLVAVSLYVAFQSHPQCLTRSCHRKAVLIVRDSMNNSVKPCINFPHFACGSSYNSQVGKQKLVKSRNDNSTTELGTTVISFISEKVDYYYHKHIIHLNMTKPKNPLTHIIGKVNYLCSEEQNSNREFDDYLKLKFFAVYPDLFKSNWDGSNFAMEKFEAKSRLSGFSAQGLFSCYFSRSPQNRKENLVFIAPPGYNTWNWLSVETFESIIQSETGKAELKECMTGRLKDIANVQVNDSYFDGLLELQTKIFKAVEVAKVKREKPLILSFIRLKKKIPFIDWTLYFEILFSRVVFKSRYTPHIPQKVVILNRSYFLALRGIIKEYEQYIATFLVLKNLEEFVIYYKPQTVSDCGSIAVSEEDGFCPGLLKKYFNNALVSLVLERFPVSQGGQSVLHNIASSLKEELSTSIRKSHWMDNKTKTAALIKLKYLKLFLSASDEQLKSLLNPLERDTYYAHYCLKESIVLFLTCANKIMLRKNFELSSREMSTYDETIFPFHTTITYDIRKNQLVVPPWILQFPVLDAEWPYSITFGSIGPAMANAILQGFSKKGSSVGPLGEIVDWWSDDTKQKYNKKRAACIQSTPKLSNNSRKSATLEEEFCKVDGPSSLKSKLCWRGEPKDGAVYVEELEGVNLAYQAYLRFMKGLYFKVGKIPDLWDYSAEENFFMSFSNLYSLASFKYLSDNISKAQLVKQKYSMETTLTSVTHLKSFKTSFGCSNFDKRYDLVNKCLLW